MLSLIATLALAQSTPNPPNPPQEITVPQQVRSLPGSLDSVLVFNSNSPELVQEEGILLSTFPSRGMQTPAAHLNVVFQGRFDVFAHHIAKAKTPEDLRSLYLGILLHNPGKQPVTVDILSAASYLSQPDAPFVDLPPAVNNPLGTVYAGPGSRSTDDILRGWRQDIFPPKIVIPPGESRMVLNLPIPVKTLNPPLNGRSTLMRLWSSGPVYAASLARFADQKPDGDEQAPTLEEWQTLLQKGNLAGPRDRPPTPLDVKKGGFAYGRVAGVSQGSQWKTQLVDNPQASLENWFLSLPQPGQAFSYGISTLIRGTLGTDQVQTAKMVARYPDTAYQAHGNYSVEYNLTLPLRNTADQSRTVAIVIETPLKEDKPAKGLRFFQPPAKQVFFRGTVRLRYNDDQGLPQTRYVHLVQRRGQQGEPLVLLMMKPGDRRLVQVDLLYPADSTPPQILTVRTLGS
ncbi:MAG: DUF3370 domain-containing protein [Kovacikia sp.]